MGALVSSSIPNLIGGVSQQPWQVRLPAQCEAQENCHASVTEFLRRRPATEHVARILAAEESPTAAGLAAHLVDRDARERYLMLATGDGGIRVFALDGTEKVVTDKAADGYLKTTSPETAFRFLTINDYTFVLNTERAVRMKDGKEDLSPVRSPEALVFVKQASYNTTYTVELEGEEYSFTTEDGLSIAGEPADELSSKQIIEDILRQIEEAHPGVYTLETVRSTLWVRRKDGKDFKLKVSDSRSNTHIVSFRNSVQRFADLPTTAPDGYVVEIRGDASSSFDNYYVVFSCDEGNAPFGAGVWMETVRPGIPYELDAATMPHVLIRQADGTFSLEQAPWTGRTCGDENNAPQPSFVGREIHNLLYYRNRLGFLSWDNCVLSKTGEFFQFFVSTVTTLLDDDPIDIAASVTRPANLVHSASYTGGLLLFSETTQFVFEHDSVLANSTASIRPVTEFEADMTAAPVSSGKTIFFAARRGRYAALREYYTLPDNADQNDAADVTAHVPRYMEGRILSMSCSTNEDILFCRVSGAPNALYVYKYYWNGQEKAQSCWGRWTFSGNVLACGVIDAELYMLVHYPEDGLSIEKLNFEPAHRDADAAFEYCLDRKIDESRLQLNYDVRRETTRATLPYRITDPERYVFVGREAATSPNPRPVRGVHPGRVLKPVRFSRDGRSVWFKGNVEGAGIFAGVPFASSYTFSTLGLRDDNGRGGILTDGRLQLRRLTLGLAATGYLEALVRPRGRNPSTYPFPGKTLAGAGSALAVNTLHDGTFSLPLLCRNTDVSVTLQSSSFLPFAVVNATWEGFWNSRSKRV